MLASVSYLLTLGLSTLWGGGIPMTVDEEGWGTFYQRRGEMYSMLPLSLHCESHEG